MKKYDRRLKINGNLTQIYEEGTISTIKLM